MRLKDCLFSATITVALAVSASAQEVRQVKMIYSAVSGFSTAFVAQEQGIFKKNNIDVDFQLTNNTGNSPAAVVSNSVQIAGTTMSTVLQAVDAGLDLVLFSGSIRSKATSLWRGRAAAFRSRQTSRARR